MLGELDPSIKLNNTPGSKRRKKEFGVMENDLTSVLFQLATFDGTFVLVCFQSHMFLLRAVVCCTALAMDGVVLDY
jgi:hypothetical protein